jgi:hypothetical protein
MPLFAFLFLLKNYFKNSFFCCYTFSNWMQWIIYHKNKAIIFMHFKNNSWSRTMPGFVHNQSKKQFRQSPTFFVLLLKWQKKRWLSKSSAKRNKLDCSIFFSTELDQHLSFIIFDSTHFQIFSFSTDSSQLLICTYQNTNIASDFRRSQNQSKVFLFGS